MGNRERVRKGRSKREREKEKLRGRLMERGNKRKNVERKK
jgi:hypothetical protein